MTGGGGYWWRRRRSLLLITDASDHFRDYPVPKTLHQLAIQIIQRSFNFNPSLPPSLYVQCILRQSGLVGGITFSTCPLVRPITIIVNTILKTNKSILMQTSNLSAKQKHNRKSYVSRGQNVTGARRSDLEASFLTPLVQVGNQT